MLLLIKWAPFQQRRGCSMPFGMRWEMRDVSGSLARGAWRAPGGSKMTSFLSGVHCAPDSGAEIRVRKSLPRALQGKAAMFSPCSRGSGGKIREVQSSRSPWVLPAPLGRHQTVPNPALARPAAGTSHLLQVKSRLQKSLNYMYFF